MNLLEAEDYMRRCNTLFRRGLNENLVIELQLAGSWELLRDLERTTDEHIERMNQVDRELRDAR